MLYKQTFTQTMFWHLLPWYASQILFSVCMHSSEFDQEKAFLFSGILLVEKFASYREIFNQLSVRCWNGKGHKFFFQFFNERQDITFRTLFEILNWNLKLNVMWDGFSLRRQHLAELKISPKSKYVYPLFSPGQCYFVIPLIGLDFEHYQFILTQMKQN